MSDKELSKVVKMIVDIITPVIREEIKKTVNGKIDKLNKSVEDVHIRLTEQDAAMAPALQTISTIKNGRNFIVWAAPLLASIGAMMAYFKHTNG